MGGQFWGPKKIGCFAPKTEENPPLTWGVCSLPGPRGEGVQQTHPPNPCPSPLLGVQPRFRRTAHCAARTTGAESTAKEMQKKENLCKPSHLFAWSRPRLRVHVGGTCKGYAQEKVAKGLSTHVRRTPLPHGMGLASAWTASGVAPHTGGAEGRIVCVCAMQKALRRPGAMRTRRPATETEQMCKPVRRSTAQGGSVAVINPRIAVVKQTKAAVLSTGGTQILVPVVER